MALWFCPGQPRWASRPSTTDTSYKEIFRNIQHIKNWVVGCVWGEVQICHSLLAPVNPDWFYLTGFTFLVPAYLGSSRQNPEGHKTVVVAVAVVVSNWHFWLENHHRIAQELEEECKYMHFYHAMPCQLWAWCMLLTCVCLSVISREFYQNG